MAGEVEPSLYATGAREQEPPADLYRQADSVINRNGSWRQVAFSGSSATRTRARGAAGGGSEALLQNSKLHDHVGRLTASPVRSPDFFKQASGPIAGRVFQFTRDT